MRASIAILSWNSARMIRRAAQSALEQTHPDVDVIVLDNGSTDGTIDLLPGLEALGCRTVRSSINLGYAEGMNAAYRASEGDVFVAMNCDAVLHPEFVANAVKLLDDRPDVGIVGALVYRLEGHDFPWQAAPASRPPIDGFVVGLGPTMRTRLVAGPGDTASSFKANGACPVLRRSAVEQILAAYGTGPFDPVFDTYGEDVDLAFKAWALGWGTVASAAVIAAHERSYGTAPRVYDRRGRLRVNSIAARHLNAWRHLPRSMLPGTAALLIAGDMGLTAHQLIRAEAGIVRDVGRAWARVWRHRRDLRRFRRLHPPPSRRLVRARMQARDPSVALVPETDLFGKTTR
jgi:GT2 family glycosyltransferase